MDMFGVRRRLLCRRLWRARCCQATAGDDGNDDDVAQVRRRKALVHLLTKILTTSQLETLARIVERRTYATRNLAITAGCSVLFTQLPRVGPGQFLIPSLPHLLLYLLVSFTLLFPFLTRFIYFLAFLSLPILSE